MRRHPHVGQDRGDFQRMNEVGLPRGPGLPFVLDRREDVGFAEKFEVSAGVVALHRFVDVFEANHGRPRAGFLSLLVQFRRRGRERQPASHFLDLAFGVGL